MSDQAREGLLSPWLREARVAAVRSYLNGSVLDVGCGSGRLAALVSPDCYYGFDVSSEALARARQDHGGHEFSLELPEPGRRFDRVVSLAVIEHVSGPGAWLKSLAAYLAGPDALVVITTPHPAMDWIHDLGASVGLFSGHAAEEHEELLGRGRLAEVGIEAGLELIRYKRFLAGANQLAVYRRR